MFNEVGNLFLFPSHLPRLKFLNETLLSVQDIRSSTACFLPLCGSLSLCHHSLAQVLSQLAVYLVNGCLQVIIVWYEQD